MKDIQGKLILVRVSARFELARVWVIGSRLYVNCTSGHLFTRLDGHKSKSSSVHEHYDKDHVGAVPEHLLSCFRVLKKCKKKFDCLVNEMLYIKQLRLPLMVQTDSIRDKRLCLAVFVHANLEYFNPLFQLLDNGVMMSPKCRNIISLVLTCLCFFKSLLISITLEIFAFGKLRRLNSNRTRIYM